MSKNKKTINKKKSQNKQKKNKKFFLLILLIIGLVIISAYLFMSNSTKNKTIEEENKLDSLMNGLQDKWTSLDLTNLSIEEKIKFSSDKTKDSDQDGIPDIDEKEGTLGFKTDPNNPDTDGDGLSDLREYWWATNPTKKDTNGDFISDGDSVNNKETYPYELGKTTTATLGSLDIDGDGLPTAVEKYELGSDYKSFSTDGDRYGDGQEYFGLDTKNEELPSYVKADMFVPSVPDIGIKVHPKIELNLARSVKIGSNDIKKGEHEYKTEKESTQTTTFSTGTKATVSASVGWPPWNSEVETTVEGYVALDYSSSSRMSKIVTDTQTTTEEIYSSKEVDLAGSTIQIWIDIVNKGTDIMSSSLKEVTLNFYMGNDKLPFYTKIIENELTNLKPNEKLTIAIDEIPLNFKLYQRLLAGETIEVRNPHYSFGEDQLFLEVAKANSVQIDIINETNTETYYVIPRKRDYSLIEILDLGGIEYKLNDKGEFIEINNKSIQSGKLPYKWIKVLVSKKNGEEESISNLDEIKVNKGDRILFKHYIDSDGDLLSDEEEIKFGSNPNNVDTDGDGLYDGISIPEKNISGEVTYGTNPLAVDSDRDGFSDYVEVIGEGNPIDNKDFPKFPVLFEHKDYTGTSRVLKDKISYFGKLENEISSIYVPKGKAIIYYFGPRLEGKGKLLLGSDSFLGDDNDKIMSIKVVNITDLPNIKIKEYKTNNCIYAEIKLNKIPLNYNSGYNQNNKNYGLSIDNCNLDDKNLLWKLDYDADKDKFNLISLENSDNNCLFSTEEYYYSDIPYLDNCFSSDLEDIDREPWKIELISKSSSRYNIFKERSKSYSNVNKYYLISNWDYLKINSRKENTWNLIVPARKLQKLE